jgi:prepilin-type N-terminal cleavage/methylation domain-containing protein
MKRSAFTLIELLVVIAIIAILAAITFPVFMRAKDAAFRNSDLSNMNTLRSALQLYRVDQGAYPPALLGYETLYTSGPNMGQIIPADQLRSFLYNKRVESIATFKPSYNKEAFDATTLAVWPNQDPRAVNTAPLLDNNGDGALSNADDDGCARQAFGPADGNVMRLDPVSGSPIPARFYNVSGYDVETVKTPTGPQTEVHYALFWTKWSLNSDPSCGGPGSSLDDPRQLGYADPPDTTPVTWNSYFREYDSTGATLRERRELVLFLGGSAKTFDSADVADRSWRILP